MAELVMEDEVSPQDPELIKLIAMLTFSVGGDEGDYYVEAAAHEIDDRCDDLLDAGSQSGPSV